MGNRAQEFVDSLSEHANKGRHVNRAFEELLSANPDAKQVPCVAVLFEEDRSVVMAAYTPSRIEIVATEVAGTETT